MPMVRATAVYRSRRPPGVRGRSRPRPRPRPHVVAARDSRAQTTPPGGGGWRHRLRPHGIAAAGRGRATRAGGRGSRAVSAPAASMTAVPLTFAAIDFETANPSNASACAVGVVVVEDDRVVERVGWPIRPPAGYDAFTAWNIRIHGITPADAADASGWTEQLEDLVALVGDRPIVAHNARFDVGVIRAACAVTGATLPPFDYFCSLAIARRTYALDSYRLPVVADAA